MGIVFTITYQGITITPPMEREKLTHVLNVGSVSPGEELSLHIRDRTQGRGLFHVLNVANAFLARKF